MTRVLLPLQPVRVSGVSMVPALRPGDLVIMWRGARTRPGDVVLGRFDDLPATWVIKRAVRPYGEPHGDRWFVASDNAAAGGDSRTHGAARVSARALLLVRGGRPHRVPPAR